MRQRKYPTDAESCQVVVTHHERFTWWSLCDHFHRHEIDVETIPHHIFDKDRAPETKTARVCGYHLRRLNDGHVVDLHDGTKHWMHGPNSVRVQIKKGETS